MCSVQDLNFIHYLTFCITTVINENLSLILEKSLVMQMVLFAAFDSNTL